MTCQGKQQNCLWAKSWWLKRIPKAEKTGRHHSFPFRLFHWDLSWPFFLGLCLCSKVVVSLPGAHSCRFVKSSSDFKEHFFWYKSFLLTLVCKSIWGTSQWWHFLSAPSPTPLNTLAHTQTPTYVPGRLNQTINKHPLLKSLLPNWKIICWQCL